MIKAFGDFKSEGSRSGGYEMLPAGPYVGKIIRVDVEGQEPRQRLVLDLEVTEGPHANYYTNRYNHDKSLGGKYEVRYKGRLRLTIPNDADTETRSHDFDKKKFNDAIYRIEQSNPGYHWDWDERKLAGKAVGFSVQEGTMESGYVFTTPARLESVQDVRDGKVKVMPPRKPRGGSTAPTDAATGMPVVDNESLPF